MSEEWRPVVGWEGLYEVSDQGRVKSLARTIVRSNGRPQDWPERILKAAVLESGHYVVGLCRGGQLRSRTVHLLVMDAFVGPAPEGLECRHFDDVKSNNAIGNLRWGTRSENQLDSVRNGTHVNSRKTRCIHGHEFSDANTYEPPGRKQRQCRACKTIRKNTPIGASV